ncbi:hypothetical protein LguiB_013319 [Lonicera macranthoides]
MANLTLKRLLLVSSYLPHQSLRRITPQISTICQRHFLSTVSVSDSDSDKSSLLLSSFTVQYLMNTCGLPLKDALSASRKFHLKESKSQKHESVLFLLRSFQFSDTHIMKLLIKLPKILQAKVNNLKPKLEYLRENGFVGHLLPDLIVLYPVILKRSLSGCIKPTFEFLRKYIHTSEKIVAAIKRSSWFRSYYLKGTMEPNIDFLLGEGVTASGIGRLVLWQPRTLTQRLDRVVYAVRTVKELGLDPSTPKCVESIRVLLSLSHSTWNRKVQNFKTLGWSEEDIWLTFMRHSSCFALSEERIKRTVDFFVNTMQLKPEVIAAHPKILSYALNTRIRPRYDVIKVLESRKLLNKDNKNFWIFGLTEKDFLEKFVDKHLDKTPNLLEVYRGTIAVEKMYQLEQSNINSQG